MLEVDGVPVLQRNVELMRDQLGIREISIVIGYHGDVIRRHFGDGSAFGVQITYVDNPRVDLEPYSVYLAGRHITRPCCRSSPTSARRLQPRGAVGALGRRR
jgi:NDP-sugar pyrophosphorylase family protein